MDLWYGHTATTVVLLTQLPDELPAGFDTTRTYESRGWTTFERCSAELSHPFRLFSAGWKLVIDVADEAGGAKMRLPATPARMEALLAKCRFTNGADKGTVLALYEQTAAAILGSLDKLSVAGRGDNGFGCCSSKYTRPSDWKFSKACIVTIPGLQLTVEGFIAERSIGSCNKLIVTFS